MVDRIVLHIGTHKTGTTAIQGSLGDAQESLLSRGILYPRAGRVGTGHAQLAHDLVRTDGPVTDVAAHVEMLEEVRAARPATLVVSAELLTSATSSRPAAWARCLCDELKPREVSVIGYVRPQWDWIVSSYTQQVKTGGTWTSFDAFLQEWLERRSRFEYPRHFGPWKEAFGPQLQVRPYARDLLLGGDAVQDFWHVAGLGPPPELESRHINRRSGVRTTEMVRALSAFLAEHRLDDLLPVRRVLRRATWRAQDAFPDDARFAPLTSGQLARIAERFSASNDEFVRDYMEGHHANLFRPPETVPEPSTWSLSQASAWERMVFAELVAGALAEVDAGHDGAGGVRPSRRGGRRRRRPPGGQRSGREKPRPGPVSGRRRAVRRLRRRLRLRTRLG